MRCCLLSCEGGGGTSAGLAVENERLRAELSTALQAAAQWKALHGKLRDYAMQELIESGS